MFLQLATDEEIAVHISFYKAHAVWYMIIRYTSLQDLFGYQRSLNDKEKWLETFQSPKYVLYIYKRASPKENHF